MSQKVEALFQLRKRELQRRVESLPTEIATWRARSTSQRRMDVHFSQLNAIEALVSAMIVPQRAAIDTLDPAGQEIVFSDSAFEVIRGIIRTQAVWDFFRDKLELRFLPEFADALWCADTIAWDCYRPVMDRAVQAGIVAPEVVREPPLTYLTAEFSPATWVRGSRPNDGRNYQLGTSLLPIPTIEIPWDHIQNVWELLSLHHEVGHDIEADLKLRPKLLATLEAALVSGGVSTERRKVWASWQGEIFADLVGLQLAGPAFCDAMVNLLLLPRSQVVTFRAADPHPTHYVRLLLLCQYARTLVPGRQEIEDHVSHVEALWTEVYGNRADFQPYLQDFSLVYPALMDTSFDVLQGETVRTLMPFTANDDTRIRSAASFLQSGQGMPTNLRPRHCVSAARLAIGAATGDPGSLSAEMNTIQQLTQQLIETNTPSGLRGTSSSAHRKFVESFAEALLALPNEMPDELEELPG